MSTNKKNILRYAAGFYWLITPDQRDLEYKAPFTMNETGAFLWRALETGTSQENLEQLLCNEYGLDEKEAQADVKSFLGQLIAHDIMTN